MFGWLKQRSASRDTGAKIVATRPTQSAQAGQAIDPNDVGQRVAFAVGLIRLKQYEEAKTHLNRTILLDPANGNAFYLLGKIAQECGNLEAAKEHFQEALEIKPDFEAAINDLAALHRHDGQTEIARQTLLAGLAHLPGSAQLHYRLGLLHADARELRLAFDCYNKALLHDPAFAEAYWYRGEALQQQGDVIAAAASVRQALACEPGLLAANSTLLWLLSFQSEALTGNYLLEARRYGQKAQERALPFRNWHSEKRADTADRFLRVGFVSGDLRAHPVGLFLEGVLATLDLTKLELVAYSTNPQDDALTERIKPHFSTWVPIGQMSDEEAARQIHADGIDILVDLAGHSANNRLPVFAWKPAPVQVSWLGYLASTGVPGIDYLLGDPISVPDTIRDQFTEAIWHLPETFNCFTPPPADPKLSVAALPALRNGYVTFGSFQRVNKLDDNTLALWARILRMLPQSRLVLRNQGMNSADVRVRLLERMGLAGIEADRVTFGGPVPHRDDFLATYAEVDVLLDTLSYPGTTTTCEALWMGVPTLTLAGQTMLRRVGASLLTCAGLKQWVAGSEDEYVALAVAHASDVQGLVRLREGLRQQVAATALFDATRFAPQLEAALFAIWRRQTERTDRVTHAQPEIGVPCDINASRFSTHDAIPERLYQLGKSALEQGNLEGAIDYFNRALAGHPAFELALRDLSLALFQSGQRVEARIKILQGVVQFPQSPDFHFYLGNLDAVENRYQEALAAWQVALRLDPDYVQVHFNIGYTLIKARCSEQALPSLDRALALDPRHVDAHNNRGNALLALSRFAEAMESYQNALHIDPANTDAMYNIGCVHMGLGQMDQSMASFRSALNIKPDYFQAYSSLLWALSFASKDPASEYLVEARTYGSRVKAHAVPYSHWRIDPSESPRPPLKVGLVSGDLRAHPVGYFLAEVLAKLDSAKFDLVAYSMNPYDDALTLDIRRVCSAWTSIAELSDADAARQIHQDGVAILIDLAGHSGHNRLPVFAWKPAPVQLSWLGYLASTGVPGMDYVLADAIAVPETLRAQFTEHIWHLPETFHCFTPPTAHPALAVAPTPALCNGFVTFGSFQRANKLTDATLALWARILQALPHSRLRLQNAQNDNSQAKLALQVRVVNFGISLDRCTFIGAIEGRENHLAAHAEVDIVLDTFPYPGTTTTVEALWMGVPTVTLAGATMLERVGASLLTCAGLKEWVAQCQDDYVALAIRHGSNIARLALLRSHLREDVAATPLFDASRFVPQLEIALRAIWDHKMNSGRAV